MAVSGSQKTRIGASISGVAAKVTITAKAEGEAVSYRKKQVGMLRRVGKVNSLG